MKELRYTNTENKSIEISMKPPFLLQNMEGFGPIVNEIATTKSFGTDGEVFNHSQLGVRDIVIEGTILAESSEQLAEFRRSFTKVFNPKITGSLDYMDHGKQYTIDVLVEHGANFELDELAITQKFQLILKALDPLWTDKSEIDAEIPMAREENLMEFPLEITDNFEFSKLIAGDVIEITNNGDVATGAVFTINVSGILINPRLYNVITQEYFALNGTFTPGTQLRISTLRGQKKVEQNDGEGFYNIMTKRKVESTFLQIGRGINYLQLQADEGVAFTTSYIRFEPKVLGV